MTRADWRRISKLRRVPKYGNDDDRADEIGVWLLKTFMDKLKKHHTYRDSEPTTSILTITSNVVYGKATGAMPDGRKAESHSHRSKPIIRRRAERTSRILKLTHKASI